MQSPESLFSNQFDNPLITALRLYNFGSFSLEKFTAANGSGDYQDLIDLLTPDLAALLTELNDLDTALNIQKGKTSAVDTAVNDFKKAMSEKEGTIADKLGGRTTAAYMEFYPHGITEYSVATKTEMPVLVQRVRTAATTHAVALGTPLSDFLIAFKAQFGTARSQQEAQVGVVDDTRTQRTEAEKKVQDDCHIAVHTIATMFPGDVTMCSSFFDFSLLFATGHHTVRTKSGSIAPLAIAVIQNKTMTDTNKIHVENTDENADLFIYIGETPTSQPGDDGVTVKPGKGKNPKPSTLGDLGNTCLLVKNMSTVNEGSYVVKVS